MTKRDIVGYLGISMKTLYNWEKERPNLYKTVMKGLAYDEIVELNKEVYEKAVKMREKFGKGKTIRLRHLSNNFKYIIIINSLEREIMSNPSNNEKKIFIKIIEHPVYHAVGIISLAIAVITALIIGLYSAVNSKVEQINFEYTKFIENKDKYETFINDVATIVINKREEVKNIEMLYINNLLRRVDTLSKSNSFNSDNIEIVNLVTQLLKNDLDLLKIFFYQTKDNKLKKQILTSFELFSKQNNIKIYSLKPLELEVSYNKKINNLNVVDIYCLEKINLLQDILNFIGKNSYEFDLSNEIYSKFLSDYDFILEINKKDSEIINGLKNLLKESFVFF